MGAYRYLWIIACLTVALRLISDVTAGKLTAIAGVGVSVSIVYFPLTYILSDVVTEVYGYARARSILWITAFCSLLAGALYQVVTFIPPAPFFTSDAAYSEVFGAVPHILLGGWLAVAVGDFANNYVLAKMKVWSDGRHLSARLIGSTVAGQAADTSIFYVVAFYGVAPTGALLQAMALNFVLKVAFESALTPLTVRVCRWIKRREGVDHFDLGTDFTPFAFGATEAGADRERPPQ